ncbi:hypothetical protein OAN307_c07430 [Octadecabacter antarcticus 307]|uniref:Uncharacterized protein n=1 Tax=Octadecabacter antarcticus 307 TaxID=391626 RepID=M9R403_9RHOB|nr:hypothetical protein OAN307_c07430 [Octadecabacter antarcticus 307]
MMLNLRNCGRTDRRHQRREVIFAQKGSAILPKLHDLIKHCVPLPEPSFYAAFRRLFPCSLNNSNMKGKFTNEVQIL